MTLIRTRLGLREAALLAQQLLRGARLRARGRRRDELAELRARMLQLAQLHLHAHRHPLEAPEGLAACAQGLGFGLRLGIGISSTSARIGTHWKRLNAWPRAVQGSGLGERLD